MVEGLFQPLNGPEPAWFPWQLKSAIIQFQLCVLPASWRQDEVQTITVGLFPSFPPLFISSPFPPFLKPKWCRQESKQLVGRMGGWMNSIFLYQEEVKDGCKPTVGKLKHVNLTHQNILHIPSSLNANNLPPSPSLCVVGEKSCAKFIFRWNYRWRFSSSLSITSSSLTGTHWPAVCSMEAPVSCLLFI